MSYELKWVPRGVHKVFFGAVDGREFLRSAIAVGESEGFDQLHFIVNDFTAATSFVWERAQLTEYAAINFGSMATNSDLWVAYVGRHAALHELAAALRHGLYSGGHHVGVFGSLSEAQTWLAKPRSVRQYARGMQSRDNA